MNARLIGRLSATAQALAHLLHERLRAATKPAAAPLVVGTLADLARSRSELLTENALLRQQLLILQRRVKRPRCTATDRALLVLLTSRLPIWRPALLIVQPIPSCAGIATSFGVSGVAGPGPRPQRIGRCSPPRPSP